jgi:hypothetical protein
LIFVENAWAFQQSNIKTGSMWVSTVLVLGAHVRVSVAVAHFVASEVLNMIRAMMFIEMFAAVRILAVPSVVAIEAVIHMTPEAVAPVVPRARTDEDTSGKPLWPIVAIRCAVIGRIVEIAIGTLRRWANLNSDLCLCHLR